MYNLNELRLLEKLSFLSTLYEKNNSILKDVLEKYLLNENRHDEWEFFQLTSTGNPTIT